MVKQSVEIKSHLGIHARPAALFCSRAADFQCDVSVNCRDKKVNGKNAIELLKCGIKKGTIIEICCNGTDERWALEELVKIVESLT